MDRIKFVDYNEQSFIKDSPEDLEKIRFYSRDKSNFYEVSLLGDKLVVSTVDSRMVIEPRVSNLVHIKFAEE